MGKVEEGPEEGLASTSLVRKSIHLLLTRRPQGLLISIYLRNCVTQSDQIATRRFGSSTGGVSGKFCPIQP